MMATQESVITRLRSDGRFPEALAFLLGEPVNANLTKARKCLRPAAHKNGDANPSMVVEPKAGRVECRACGLSLGLLDLVAFQGHAVDIPEAAAWLERELYGPASNVPTASGGEACEAEQGAAAGDSAWPWYPKTATSLGWELLDDGAFRVLRLPTHLPDGTPARWKVRRDKRCGKPTAMFEGEGPIGMLNVPAALDVIAGAGDATPTVFLLAGETDLLAFTYHASAEGLVGLVGVSSARGESAPMGPEWMPLFASAHVVVVYDSDKTGLKEGPKRAAEIAKWAPASVVSIHVPSPQKDVCDFLRRGGTVRELLRRADAAKSAAEAATDEPDPGAPAAPDFECVELRAKPAPLAPEALHGLAGEWWRLVAPCTEAACAAVVVQYLVLAGNAFGPRSTFAVGPGNTHGTNEFVAIVGPSSEGAKGDGLKAAKLPFQSADPEWFETRITHAANSTAGVIDLVRDPGAGFGTDLAGASPDPGCEDLLKRLTFVLSEFAALVRKFDVKGDTLSATYRAAWDRDPLQNTSKMNRATARTHHISSIAHVTPVELHACVSETEQLNGFLNRHLLVWSERAQLLPLAPTIDETEFRIHVGRLRDAIEFGKEPRSMRRDEHAERIWAAVYKTLATPPRGSLQSLLERGRPHVVRLSLIYALLDQSDVVRAEHLLAAIAVWDYVAASYEYVFGDRELDRQRQRFVAALQAAGGRAAHSAIHQALGRHWKDEVYRDVVSGLRDEGLLRVETERTGGRSATVYVLVRATRCQPILPIARAAAGGCA